jgi:hypothetical protein
MRPTNALIHVYTSSGPPSFDSEGDLMLGSYYQWIDENDIPIGELIGPYLDKVAAEKAAKRAFRYKDF